MFVQILAQKDYAPGDQAPEGYLAWHEWAEIQHKAGLRQKACGRCGLWKYPQQLSEILDRFSAKSKRGEMMMATPVCNDCAKKDTQCK